MRYTLMLACLAACAFEGRAQDEGACAAFTTPVTEQPSWKVPGRIIDISKELDVGTLHWDSTEGLGIFRERYTRIEEGDLANQSHLKDFPVHVATHVDSPGHFLHEHYESGKGVESLDLYKLNGPVLVIDIPFHTNITADALEDMKIPAGIERLIFKTLNTERGLMHKTAFDRTYTSLTKDGAEWIVENTDIGLVGIDYTSVAVFEDLPGAHNVLLPQDVIALEGLVLDEVAAGLYTLHCLPMKLQGADGAPTRCILIT